MNAVYEELQSAIDLGEIEPVGNNGGHRFKVKDIVDWLEKTTGIPPLPELREIVGPNSIALLDRPSVNNENVVSSKLKDKSIEDVYLEEYPDGAKREVAEKHLRIHFPVGTEKTLSLREGIKLGNEKIGRSAHRPKKLTSK